MRDRKVAPFGGVQSESVTAGAVFSPDGRWIAYQSSDRTNPRIFIQPVPAAGTAFPVANGRAPRFSSDGKQLFYTVADRILAVGLKTEPSLTVSNPVVLNSYPMMTIRSATTRASSLRRNWDLLDDARFIGIIDETPTATSSARHIEVVLDWFAELKQRVPVK